MGALALGQSAGLASVQSLLDSGLSTLHLLRQDKCRLPAELGAGERDRIADLSFTGSVVPCAGTDADGVEADLALLCHAELTVQAVTHELGMQAGRIRTLAQWPRIGISLTPPSRTGNLPYAAPCMDATRCLIESAATVRANRRSAARHRQEVSPPGRPVDDVRSGTETNRGLYPA